MRRSIPIILGLLHLGATAYIYHRLTQLEKDLHYIQVATNSTPGFGEAIGEF